MKQLIPASTDLLLLFHQGTLQFPVELRCHFNQRDIGLDGGDLQPQTIGQETSQMTLFGKTNKIEKQNKTKHNNTYICM